MLIVVIICHYIKPRVASNCKKGNSKNLTPGNVMYYYVQENKTKPGKKFVISPGQSILE